MKIFLISNMFPSDKDPLFGVFVRNFKIGLESCDIKFHATSVIKGKSSNIYLKIKKYIIYIISIFRNYFKNEFDLIYIHYLSINSLIIWPLLLLGIKKPIIVNVHGSDVIEEGSFMRFFNKILLLRSNLIVVPSKYFKSVMLERYKFLNKCDIFVSPSGGVNSLMFYAKGLRESQNGIITLGYISRIDEGKGWRLFLELISSLNSKGYLINGIIIGDGLQKEKMLNDIRQLNISNCIDYRGLVAQKNLINSFNEFDLFIFPTLLNESLGLVGLESMSCGVPVVASNIGGPSGYINDKHNGILFETGNITELIKSVVLYFNLSKSDKEKIRNNAINTSKEYQHKEVIKNLNQKIIEICLEK